MFAGSVKLDFESPHAVLEYRWYFPQDKSYYGLHWSQNQFYATFQINSDYSIQAVRPNIRLPVSKDIAQPAGFPLLPAKEIPGGQNARLQTRNPERHGSEATPTTLSPPWGRLQSAMVAIVRRFLAAQDRALPLLRNLYDVRLSIDRPDYICAWHARFDQGERYDRQSAAGIEPVMGSGRRRQPEVGDHRHDDNAIEKQSVKPQFRTVQALAKAFGVPPETLNGA